MPAIYAGSGVPAWPVWDSGEFFRAAVEHVSTSSGPDGFYLGLFYRGMDAGVARRDAHRICRELFTLHSELDGWDADEWPAA